MEKKFAFPAESNATFEKSPGTFLFSIWLFQLAHRLISGKYRVQGTPRYLLWSGKGYLVPFVVITLFTLLRPIIEFGLGAKNYLPGLWLNIATLILFCVLCWLIGLQLDRSLSLALTNEQGRSKFLWLPVKYAGLLTAVLILPSFLIK